MKKTAFLFSFCVAGFLAPAHSMSALAAEPQQPVYIFLSTSVSDPINWAISEERLRRTLSAIEKYRKDDPTLTATVYFSGSMSDALSQHNAQDHLLDFVRDYIKRGAVQPGYDGSDEPTYDHRPMLDFSKAKNAEERWLVRMDCARELLSQARDPITGVPQPGKSGGLKRMQEVFGPAAIIRGVFLQTPNLWGRMNEVGSDSEIVNAIRQLNTTAIMGGLYETDLGHTSGSMFRPWANSFSQLVGADPDTSPELYWQEDVLRLSETSLTDWRTFRAEDGVEKLKAALKGLNRSRRRIVHVEIGGQRIYAKPPRPPMPRLILPLAYAYEHPDSPLFPANLRYSASEVEANYAQQEAVLKYLVSEFLPANPGSRFVSTSDLKAPAKPGWGYDLSFERLRGSVEEMLKAWGDKRTPPPFLKVGDRYLSLGDLFEVLADALGQRSNSGRFPASVHVGRVFGPVLTAQPQPPATGEVTAESVSRVGSKLVEALHDDSWSPRPHNAIPSPVGIENLSLTPAQFLRLMAEALVASPETKLHVKPVDMFAGRIMTFYNRRPRSELGAPWTYKPAVLETSANFR
jgi:hypothetical protein